MKVRTGSTYRYNPVPMDRVCPWTRKLPAGVLLKVVRPYGCPPPNTMGHCHVTDAATEEGLWLVHTNSLEKVR